MTLLYTGRKTYSWFPQVEQGKIIQMKSHGC